MNLEQLLGSISYLDIKGFQNQHIHQIFFDSRAVTPNSLFVARRGVRVDGHQYIEKAIANGARAIVCEDLPLVLDPNITYIQVEDAAKALGWLADVFYGHPSKSIKLVGITGTNGKTTTVTLLHELFTSLGFKVGLLSTIQNKIGDQSESAQLTTPDVLAINEALRKMVDHGCSYAFMEVSSHAIHQKRIEGLTFAGAIFSNISHDHLDYHGTFKAYIDVKKQFFDHLLPSAFALTNIDDRRGLVMVQNTKARIFHYSFQRLADYKGKIIENHLNGLHLAFNDTAFFSRLIGNFNAYNLLATFACAHLLGIEHQLILTHLSNIKAAPGRFEYLRHPEKKITGIIDYAHTPDALEKVLLTIKHLKPIHSKVITIVGCGGDRDRAKRPEMARIAQQHSQLLILTSDNPRSEDPMAIIDDMKTGIDQLLPTQIFSLPNRREAIQLGVQLAQPNDIILVAGKGHETYQEIQGIRHPFDDKAVLSSYFRHESDNH